MTKTFTQDDLVRFIYEDTTKEENIQLQNALVCDAELLDRYKRLLEIKKDLDRGFVNPPQRVVDAALNYSRSLNLHTIK